MLCLNCYSTDLKPPETEHPGYLVCPNCGAIELTYEPQPYQEAVHNVPYMYNEDGSLRIQIMGIFGGRKSHSRRKTIQIQGNSKGFSLRQS